jgi:hypothetical protein
MKPHLLNRLPVSVSHSSNCSSTQRPNDRGKNTTNGSSWGFLQESHPSNRYLELMHRASVADLCFPTIRGTMSEETLCSSMNTTATLRANYTKYGMREYEQDGFQHLSRKCTTCYNDVQTSITTGKALPQLPTPTLRTVPTKLNDVLIKPRRCAISDTPLLPINGILIF